LRPVSRYIALINNVLLFKLKTTSTLRRRVGSLFVLFTLVYLAAQAQTPLANFTGTPTSGCSPLIVNFQDQSSNSPTSWFWDFGNGSTSTLQNPSATYINPGTYTVVLTATNGSGSNTLTRTNYITVNAAPAVDFSGTPLAGCFPLNVQFTDLSTPGAGNTNTVWDWNFGDGAISSLQNPAHAYATAGNFSVTLKVTNDKGCFKILNKPLYVQVTPGVVAGFTNTNAVSCSAPVTVNFTDTSTGPGTLTYAWNFGDGGSSALQNPSHTYAASGAYTVTLTVTSSQGCAATFVKTNAVVIGNNVTDFSVPDTVCINENITFTNISTPVPLSSLWNFGDGGTSTLINPTHIYTATGVFPVKLVNTYSGCIDSIIKNVVAVNRPIADFTAVDSTNCQPPFTVNFQDLSSGVIGWLWNFGDGGTSTLQNPSHTYTTYGNFTVTLIATSSAGCADTLIKTNFVRVNRPIITIIGLPDEGCTPHTITPVANVVTLDNVTSWFWDFGDGFTSTLQNPSHTYTAQGTYTVSLTITTSDGCTETLTINGAVKTGTNPTVDFSASPLISCANEPVQFTDLSVPAITVNEWLWDFGDGSTSDLKNPAHQFADTGFFTIKLVAKNSGCADSIIKTNYIRILPPVARFTASLNCANRNVFTFTDQSVLPLTWFWDFGDGTTANVQNPPPHTFPGLGVYNVMLVVTNGGCTDTAIQVIRVINENPDISATPTTICRRDSIRFNAINITASNISLYEWDFGDGMQTSGAANSIWHTYTNSGNYTVRLITTDLNGCRDTIIKNNFVRVNGPTANFSASNNNGCIGLTATFNDLSVTDGVNPIVSWQWNFGDGSTQTFTSPPFTHTYNTQGAYAVWLQVTDAAGCIDTIRINDLVHAADVAVTFSTLDTLSCPGAPIYWNVNATSLNFSAFLWDFGDGTSSTLSFPPKSYSAPGVYTVKLYGFDFYGCVDSLVRTNYIRIDVPQADFQMDDSVSICNPFEVNFTNTSTYYNSQVWTFEPGVISNLQNPAHYFTNPGLYNVELIITSPGGCKDTTYRSVRLIDTTGFRITYGPLFSGCKPFMVNFNAVANGASAYIWDFGDGQTVVSNSPAITHTYTNFGNFIPKVILQDSGGGCQIPLTGSDTLRIAGPTANFGLDTLLLCDGGLINFTDSTIFNDPITNYSWNFGDGGTSTLQNPSHFYAGPGFYSVTLAVLTQLGCTDTLRLDSVLKIVASPQIRIDGDTAACALTPLQIFGNLIVPDTSAIAWNWNIGNGNTSTQQNPGPQTFPAAGNYTATLIATNSTGCNDTTTRNIRIHPLPTVTMPPELTVVAGNSITIPATYSGNMSSYTWSPPTFLSCSSCPRPDATPDRNITYTVSFADSNSCVNTGSILIKVSCKNSNVFVPNTFSPNGDGSNDVFYPRGTGINRTKVLRIFNRWGEVVFERYDFPVNIASNGWDGTMKGRKADNGVYVYQLEIYCQNGELLTFTGNVTLIR
jgi:gliding motility-associated-like protein